MLGVRYKYSNLNKDNTTNNTNVNRYSNNGGGSSTLKKKYGAKLAPSKNSFSINSSNNHYYTGNPNSNFSNDPFSSNKNNKCFTPNNNTNISVKNYHALRQTRIVNNQVKSNINISHQCYKDSNPQLLQRYENNDPLNKHFNSLNKSSSMNIYLKKTNCFQDSSFNDISNNLNNSNCHLDGCPIKYNNINYNDQLLRQSRLNNITKDQNKISGQSSDYSRYYSDPNLFRKKKCLYNPRNSKVIAC